MSVGRVFLRYLAGTVLVAALVIGGVAVRVAATAQVDERSATQAIVVLGAAQYNGTLGGVPIPPGPRTGAVRGGRGTGHSDGWR